MQFLQPDHEAIDLSCHEYADQAERSQDHTGCYYNDGRGTDLVFDTIDAEPGYKHSHKANRGVAKDQAEKNNPVSFCLLHHMCRVGVKCWRNGDVSGHLLCRGRVLRCTINVTIFHRDGVVYKPLLMCGVGVKFRSKVPG